MKKLLFESPNEELDAYYLPEEMDASEKPTRKAITIKWVWNDTFNKGRSPLDPSYVSLDSFLKRHATQEDKKAGYKHDVYTQCKRKFMGLVKQHQQQVAKWKKKYPLKAEKVAARTRERKQNAMKMRS